MTQDDRQRRIDETGKRGQMREREAGEADLAETCNNLVMPAEEEARIRHRKLGEIFSGAKGLTGQTREDYLNEACGDDASLRAEVEDLLRHDLPTVVPPPPPPPPLPGLPDFGPQFRIIEPIARSGMGDVYLAERLQPFGNKRVAIKVLQSRWMTSREITDRFRDEARALIRIEGHRNIARIEETGETQRDRRPFFVMEYVPGAKGVCTLCDERRLGIHDRLRLFLQVCEAVEHAHSRGIIHRDIKPSNVLVMSNGDAPSVKVIDFGIAKAIGDEPLSDRDATLVTPLTINYASPEQLRRWLKTAGSEAERQDDPADETLQTDVFSLGLLLYELLAGCRPYDDEGDQRHILIDRKKDIPLPSERVAAAWEKLESIADRRSEDGRSLVRRLRGELDWVTMKALEVDVQRRYPTVTHLREDVQRMLRGDPVSPGSAWIYRARKFVTRHRWPVAAAGVAAVVAVLSIVAVLQHAHARQLGQLNTELQASNRRLRISEDVMRNLALGAAIEMRDGTTAASMLGPMREARGDTTGVPWERRYLASRASEDVGGFDIGARSTDIAVAPGGRWAAAVAPGAHPLHLIDLKREEARVLAGASGHRLNAVAFHPSGRYVVAGGGRGGADLRGPGLLQVWSTEEGANPTTWQLPDIEDVGSIKFVPVAQRLLLAVMGWKGGVYLYEWPSEIQSQKPPVWTATLKAQDDASNARMLAVDPQGRYLAVVDKYARNIDLWDVEASLAAAERVAGGPCGVRAASLDGVHDYHVQAISFSPDGTLLASASMDRSIVLWDVNASVLAYEEDAPGVVAGRLRDDDRQGSLAVAFLGYAGRTLLLSAGADGTVRQWDIGPLSRDGDGIEAERQATWMGHRNPVYAIEAARTECLILTGSDDGTFRLWAPDTAVPATLTGYTSSVHGVAFSADGEHAFSLGGSRNFIVHDVRSGAEVTRLTVANEGTPSRMVYESSLGVVVTAIDRTDGHVIIVGVENPTMPHVLASFRPFEEGDDARPFELALSRSGRLAIGDRQGRVQIWDIAGGEPVRLAAPRDAGRGRVRALAFLDPQGTRLVTTTAPETMEDGEEGPAVIARWAIDAEGIEELSPVTSRHEEPITALAVDAEGRWLATASEDHRVDLWTIDSSSAAWLTPSHERMLEGHFDPVMSLAFHPTEPRLASGAMDSTIKLWDLATGLEVATLRDKVGWPSDLAFSHDGMRLLSGSSGYEGSGNVAYLWDTFDSELERRQITRERAIARTANRLMWRWVYPRRNGGEELGASAIRARIDAAGPDFTPSMRDALRRALEVRLRDESWRPRLVVRDALAALAAGNEARFFEELRELRNPSPNVQNMRAWVVVRSAGHEATVYEEALSWIGEAIAKESEEPAYVNTLGVALYRVGDYERALDTLTRSTGMNGGEQPSDWAFIAMTHHSLGDDEAARDALIRLRKLMETPAGQADPDNVRVAEEAESALSHLHDERSGSE